MALDGAFLRHLKKEITDRALGARVDKIYQPNKEELVFLLRTRQAVSYTHLDVYKRQFSGIQRLFCRRF